MSEDIIERAARAMSGRAAYIMIGADPSQMSADPRELVRAAIATLREPTEDMLDAASRTFPPSAFDNDYERYLNIKRVWQAMIGEALR